MAETKLTGVTDADFDTALSKSTRGSMDLDSALSLFYGASRRDRALQLFRVASKIRDRNLGKKLTLTAHIHMITSCELSPSCLYCSLSSSYRAVSNERSRLTQRELIRAVKYAIDRGAQSIVLVGGTDLSGSDSLVRATVQKVREVTEMDLALDVGPSLSAETVGWLKDKNVNTIYCSIETANGRVFARAKPGDSLDARVGFMERLQREGVKLGNVVMNGLGNNTDLLESILYSRRFRNTSHLYISTFHPVRGTPWASRHPASVQGSLKALAIARLAFPKAHIGLAEVEVEDPGSAARTSSQLLAGGGNSFAGLLIYKKRRIDNTEPISREASTLGFATASTCSR
jgi:biotin synthase